jgi:hypothetical protein
VMSDEKSNSVSLITHHLSRPFRLAFNPLCFYHTALPCFARIRVRAERQPQPI